MSRTLAVWTALALAPAALPQTAPTPGALTLEQKERFLLTARVVSIKEAAKGITHTKRATLTDGVITHDASIQSIDERLTKFETAMGSELNFRDTYKFNIAAYRLAKLLGLESMVPPSVDRRILGAQSAVTWWIEDVQMDESQRVGKKIETPDKDRWARQYQIMRVFDELIYNTDRNMTNILYDGDWRLWMIDHTRAFRRYRTLPDPKHLERCDRQLLANLKKLDAAAVTAELKGYVEPDELKGLLARRDRIVAFFDDLGPASLYDFLPAVQTSCADCAH